MHLYFVPIEEVAAEYFAQKHPVSIRRTCLQVAAAAAGCSDSHHQINPQFVVLDFVGPARRINLQLAAVDFVGCFGQVHRRALRLVAYSDQTGRFVVVCSVCFVQRGPRLVEAGFVDYSGPDCQIVPRSAVAGLAGCFAQVLQTSCH